MRTLRPPRGQAWRGPKISPKLLHGFLRIDTEKKFNQENGGFHEDVSQHTSSFQGVILPINNEDLQYLPEGTSTTNTQKIYTNGETLRPGQAVEDGLDGQIYTVGTELTHNPIHGLKRYTVSRKGVASNK